MRNIGRLSYFFLIGLLLNLSSAYAEQDEFLKPEQAFVLNHSQLKTDKEGQYYIQAKWKIADGYYMYKNKVSFYTDNTEIKLAEPSLPAGKMKNDEFLGETEIYKKQLQVNIPLSFDNSSSQTAAKTVTITAKTQGCAEAGICYPPFRQAINFSLPVKQAKAITPESILSDIGAKSTNNFSSRR